MINQDCLSFCLACSESQVEPLSIPSYMCSPSPCLCEPLGDEALALTTGSHAPSRLSPICGSEARDQQPALLRPLPSLGPASGATWSFPESGGAGDGVTALVLRAGSCVRFVGSSRSVARRAGISVAPLSSGLRSTCHRGWAALHAWEGLSKVREVLQSQLHPLMDIRELSAQPAPPPAPMVSSLSLPRGIICAGFQQAQEVPRSICPLQKAGVLPRRISLWAWMQGWERCPPPLACSG